MKNLATARFGGALLIAAGMTCSPPCIAQTGFTATTLEVTVSPELDVIVCPLAQLQKELLSRSPRASKVLLPATSNHGQITAVNGRPANGSFVDTLGWWLPIITVGPADPPPYTSGLETWTFDLRQADGTPIGTITASGFPGSGQFAITTGTGAYFGVQGFATSTIGSYWMSSPAPGSNIRYPDPVFQLTLYPMAMPSVAVSAGGPAVVHGADSSIVSAAFPAHSGEVLTVYALNLLPQPPNTSASLPISVTIGGIDAPVLLSGRYQNSQDGYQINLRVPPGLNSGPANLQIVSGFIAGPSVQVYVDGRTAQ